MLALRRVGLIPVLEPMKSTAVCVALFLGIAGVSHAQEETTWLTNRRVLTCAPHELKQGGTLQIRLESEHPKELAIRRRSDSSWFFLVVVDAPDDMTPLMSPSAFAASKQVSISTSQRARVSGEPLQRIFKSAGQYDVFVSENLESEAGGYMCTIRYHPRKAHGL
jgi:hypothetical protein